MKENNINKEQEYITKSLQELPELTPPLSIRANVRKALQEELAKKKEKKPFFLGFPKMASLKLAGAVAMVLLAVLVVNKTGVDIEKMIVPRAAFEENLGKMDNIKDKAVKKVAEIIQPKAKPFVKVPSYYASIPIEAPAIMLAEREKYTTTDKAKRALEEKERDSSVEDVSRSGYVESSSAMLGGGVVPTPRKMGRNAIVLASDDKDTERTETNIDVDVKVDLEGKFIKGDWRRNGSYSMDLILIDL